MRFLMLALILLGGCMNTPCTNTTQTIWEPKVAAWCDHAFRRCGNDSNANLSIEFQEIEAAILSVTTYYEGGSTDRVINTKLNKISLKDMFPEGLHGKMLKIKILVAYKGRVFKIPVFCDIVKTS